MIELISKIEKYPRISHNFMRQVKEESEDKLIGNYVLKNFYEFWLTCVLQICFLYRFDIMVVTNL